MIRSIKSQKKVAVITLLTAVFVCVMWFVPRASHLYYQSKAGKLMDEALSSTNEISRSSIICSQQPVTDQPARSKLEQASAELELAQGIYSGDSYTYLLLGRAECLLGQSENAILQLSKYQALRPGDPLGRYEISFAYEAAGDWASALDIWRSDKSTAENFFQTGEQARLTDQSQEALAWYQRAASTRPGWNRPWYSSALVYLEDGEYGKALDTLTAGIAQSKETIGISNFYYQIGWIKQYQKNPPKHWMRGTLIQKRYRLKISL